MASPIPLRNIWLLFLYAADLVQFKDATKVEAENARNLPELLARLLTKVVQQRLRRNLSRGYPIQRFQILRPSLRHAAIAAFRCTKALPLRIRAFLRGGIMGIPPRLMTSSWTGCVS